MSFEHYAAKFVRDRLEANGHYEMSAFITSNRCGGVSSHWDFMPEVPTLEQILAVEEAFHAWHSSPLGDPECLIDDWRGFAETLHENLIRERAEENAEG